MQRKIALVSGATSGFGYAIAKGFAANNFNVIITGRRADRLNALVEELKKDFDVNALPLCFDIRDKEQVRQAVSSLSQEWNLIDVLVNNAGLAAGLDFFHEASLDDWENMIDTNVKGLLFLSRQIVHGMVERKQGHVINIGSTAGKYVYEKGNVYNATKFAVDALSQAMRIDLLRHNIRVTAVHPGAAETEFSNVRFKGDEQKATNVYKGFQPLTANDVADVVLYCAMLPQHVCVNDIVVTPTAQANPYYLNRQ